ncbi:hypothetical protein B0A55_01535, partial [Friedmanniomyces simplex]
QQTHMDMVPGLVHQDSLAQDLFSATGLDFDTIPVTDKGCVDPSLIQPTQHTGAQFPDLAAVQSPLNLHTFPQAPSPIPAKSSIHSPRMSTGKAPSPSMRAQSWQPYPAHPGSRRQSISSIHSRHSHGSISSEDSNKGLCPIGTCGRHVKDLKAHMLTHQNERPEKCPIPNCEYHIKGFARKYDKNRHTLTHYKGTMVCGFCPGSGSAAEKSFNRADVFKRHLTSVHGVEQTPPNARRKSPSVAGGKRPFGVLETSGMCSTCGITFSSAQDFYEHLDDCVLRVVQQAEPSEAINEKLLSSVAEDQQVQETMERHQLPTTIDLGASTSFDQEEDGEEEDEDDEDDFNDITYGVSGQHVGGGTHLTINGAVGKPGQAKGLTRSKNGVPLTGTMTGKGSKRRKNYPLSWGAAPEKMKMRKRVLCVYDGQRRLWKDDMMLDADHEVRIPLAGAVGDGRAWVTDLDVQTLRRAEGVLNATEEEKGPWVQDDAELERLMQYALESFDDIYLDLSKQSGKCRLAESGIGWKLSAAADPWTLVKTDILSAQWSRAAKGYEMKVIARNAGVVQLDGFRQEDFETIQKCLKVWYGVEMLNREHALQGWNWGKSEMGRNEFAFSVRNRPAFEIPYTEISNTNLAGKNEVAVEFSLPADGEETGTNGHLGGARSKGRKTGGAVDQLTEMRFYIPGTETRKGKKKDQEEDGEEAEEAGEEEKNAATVFYETLMDKAEIGEVAGDTYATFLDILHLTPRGRFDIDLYEKSFRLRGKTYDYKVPYENAKRFFLLPKPDDMHQLLCIGLDPPLRQGQTRYPFIVMQFKREEEVNIELNMTDEDLKSKFNGKLVARYEAPIFQVIAKIFHGLTGKKIFQPSSQFISHHGQSGVKCSIKANEGHLYCLDRAFLFVPKPATYISYEHVSSVVMSRVGGAISASRTFDITVTLKNGAGEHQLLNINREEQSPLETLFKAKNIPFRNEMDVDGSMMAAVMNDDPDLASSDEEVVEARGSADEDDESVDEDFQADDESDVAEEFDSDAASSGGGSDAEMEDAGAGSDEDTAAKVERPKKKAKTGK